MSGIPQHASLKQQDIVPLSFARPSKGHSNQDTQLICVSPDVRPGIAPILKGFVELGILQKFVTTFAFESDGHLGRWLRRLPFDGGTQVRRTLIRRQLLELPDGKVQTYAMRELVRTFVSRVGKNEILSDRVWWWAERGFDRKVAQDWGGRAPFLYGFELASAETFRAQKRAGGKTILNQLIAHHRTSLPLMKEEMERYPDAVTNYDRHLVNSASRINALKDEQFDLSDLIVANSEFVRQSFLYAGVSAGKIVVVPGAGPNLLQDAPETRARDRVVFLSAGSQSIRKGTPYLLEAWRKIKTHAGAELWLVGKNTLPPRLFDNLPGTVVVKPAVSQAELFDIYANASVLVLPTLCEGFALVILEAMAHGLPVITTANSGCGDFVEDGVNGWIVPIRDSEVLAQRIGWCLENADQLSEMREVSRSKASCWTWDDYSKLHGQIVYSFMKNTPAAEILKRKVG